MAGRASSKRAKTGDDVSEANETPREAAVRLLHSMVQAGETKKCKPIE